MVLEEPFLEKLEKIDALKLQKDAMKLLQPPSELLQTFEEFSYKNYKSKDELEKLLEKELVEQDRKIKRAFERERLLRQQQKEAKRIEGVVVDEVSQQTKEVLADDLEELIKQQGEDIDFEFYYEQKKIQSSQTIFEMIKDTEQKRRINEK